MLVLLLLLQTNAMPSSDIHTETSVLGEEPYSVSKASMEMIVRTYQNDPMYKHSIATTRSGKS